MSEHPNLLWPLIILWFLGSCLMSNWVPTEFIDTTGKRNFLVSYSLQLLEFLLFGVSLILWPISIPFGWYFEKRRRKNRRRA